MTRTTRADAGGRAYLDLQNLARRQGRQTQTLMVIYVLERFLARLEVSGYVDGLLRESNQHSRLRLRIRVPSGAGFQGLRGH